MGNTDFQRKGVFSPSPTGHRLRVAWQASHVLSLRPESIPGRWSPALGVLAGLVSHVEAPFHCGRSLVHSWLHMRGLTSQPARGVAGVDSIPPRGANGPSEERIHRVISRIVNRLALQAAATDELRSKTRSNGLA